MQIPVIKTVLASALSALGKLVSRTSLIKAYQGIEIEGKANMLYFRTRNMAEEIEFRLFAYISLLYPQSPRHPRQKYLLTAKGLTLYNKIKKR